jgi:glycine cleavage system aminomethyltransferase T
LAVAQLDVAVGKVVYTSLLDERGGFKSDLTIMRLGAHHFRVVTGAHTGMTEKKWFVDHLPSDGSAQLSDLTSSWATFGLWGPRARDVLAACTTDDVSSTGFPFATCRTIELGGIKVLASRISYIGELGWELYVPIEEGAKAWDTLFNAGQAHGLVPVGIGVYATTGRVEKGYRALGNELTADYNIVEAGMARPSVKKQDFIGREAYLAQRDAAPVALLCTLSVDDHRSKSGVARYMLGGEPIVDLAGERLVDEKGRPSYVTTAGSAPSLGKHLLLSYLPTAQAHAGTKLMVEYLGEFYPVTVDVVGATPLFDPDNNRVRG